MPTWDLKDAVELCSRIEAICPAFGFHVALTGGLLYKGGIARKDMDLIFYQIRQLKKVDVAGLIKSLKDLGLCDFCGGGWRYVAKHQGRTIDLLFPESGKGPINVPDEEYEPGILKLVKEVPINCY